MVKGLAYMEMILTASSWLAAFVLAAPLLLTALLFSFQVNKKMFMHKLGGHIAVPLWWLSAAVIDTYLIVAVSSQNSEFLQQPVILGVLACLLALQAVFAILGLKWNLWRKMPSIHLLGCTTLSAVTAALVLLVAAFSLGLLFTTESELSVFTNQPAESVHALILAWFTKHLPAALTAIAYLVACGLALCATAGSIWLMLRRTKDDFGRDYYAYATRTLAWWAGLSSLALAGLLAFIEFSLQAAVPFYYAYGATALAGVLWLAVGMSSTPLRQKALQSAAILLFFAGLALHMVPEPLLLDTFSLLAKQNMGW